MPSLVLCYVHTYIRTHVCMRRLNGDFMNVLSDFYMKTSASAVSFSAILSYEILDFGQQLSVCVRQDN